MTAWDRDSLRELRVAVAAHDVAATRAAVAGRELDDVLQLVGDALLAAPADALTGECAERLRRRGIDGDAELADALEGRTGDLRPLAVDLEELASILEGDPVHGGGRIDLTTGEIWQQSPYDDPVDDEDLDDEEHRLWVEASSRDGWWDMSEFIKPSGIPRSPTACNPRSTALGLPTLPRRARRAPGRADPLPPVRRRAPARPRPPLAGRPRPSIGRATLRLSSAHSR